MAGSRSSKRWRWADGVRRPARLATPFGRVIDSIKTKKGAFSAKDVVNAARSRTSPIHSLFEWDDKKAGEKYRERQAGDCIRGLVVIISNGEDRTLPVAVSFGPGTDYVTTENVMSSTELREHLIAKALSEAESWQSRYQHLSELANVFAAIDEARQAVAV